MDFLIAHGAADIAHPGGTLLAHLIRTADLLGEWRASEPLMLAGLCHAAYGTDGFATALVPTSQRTQVQTIIGTEAEAIVYFYAACDRGALYPTLGHDDAPVFRDRFTTAQYVPEEAAVRTFVELTIANELDVMAHSRELAERYSASLAELFTRCRRYATPAANAAAAKLRGPASD